VICPVGRAGRPSIWNDSTPVSAGRTGLQSAGAPLAQGWAPHARLRAGTAVSAAESQMPIAGHCHTQGCRGVGHDRGAALLPPRGQRVALVAERKDTRVFRGRPYSGLVHLRSEPCDDGT
jgi:hypothetical protein